jgi:hypothetical protein
LHEIGDVPKSPVPVLTALVHVSEDKSDMRGIKARLVAVLTVLSIAFYLAEWVRQMNSFGAAH